MRKNPTIVNGKTTTRVNINSYFKHLKGLVGRVSGPSYDVLLGLIFAVDFLPLVPNDHNRVHDGLKLRKDFQDVYINRDCTLLEVIIGLAIRINDITYDYKDPDRISYWFFELINNLGLMEYNDDVISDDDIQYIDDVLHSLVNRNYEYSGLGGLFPLAYPERDQTEVELWFQMQAWLEGYDF